MPASTVFCMPLIYEEKASIPVELIRRTAQSALGRDFKSYDADGVLKVRLTTQLVRLNKFESAMAKLRSKTFIGD